MTVPLRNVLWLIIAAVVSLMCYVEAGRNRYAGILSESIDKIARHYVEPVEPRQLFEGGLRGMLSELDPYSGFIPADEYREFNVEIEQHFGGIGIEVGMQENQLTILNPFPGSPAYDAGLMAGDVIVGIDGERMEGESLETAVKLMRGPTGSMVEVEVLRRGESQPQTYKIQRAEIRIESVRGDRRDARGRWSFVLDDHPQLGYIRIVSFGNRTVEDLQAALQSIEGRIDGLILDLRGNAGGLLTSAVEICDMFLPPGKQIVSTRGRDPSLTESFWSQNPARVIPELPVVVLVDRFSASASEIFAACLQDYERATIVGERTWGKGTVQNIIELEGGRSAIRLTTQTYWRPSGENIHRHRDDDAEDAWGVKPSSPEDTIELTPEQYRTVYEARRERDYGNGAKRAVPAEVDGERNGESTDGGPERDASPREEDDETDDSQAHGEGPVLDRQLLRAIELLQQAADRSKPKTSPSARRAEPRAGLGHFA